MSVSSDTDLPSLAHRPGEDVPVRVPVRVLVPCTIDGRHQPRALEVYRELVDATRQEAGYLSYELLQRVDDSTRFVLVEEWESQDHLDAHTRTEHFVRLVAVLEQLERAEPAELYRRVL